MSYEELIKTVSSIVGNEEINKVGLSLTYSLNEKKHKQMNEQLFFLDPTNIGKVCLTGDEFEVELGGLIIKFIKNIE